MNSRKQRGTKTQSLLAQRWRELGLFPNCHDVAPGRPGNDLQNTPRLAVEVKARGRAEILPALSQVHRNAQPGELPIVVWRHNGQGPASIADWTVYMRLGTFETLWKEANG